MRRVLAMAAALLTAALPAAARSPGQAPLDDGVARYKAGDFRGALVQFQKAVDLDPALIKAWENLGWAQHRLGDDREALRVWTTVLKLEPGNVDAWNAVGDVRLAAGSWREAADAFERSLERKPEQPDARLRLGRAYEELGRPDDAAAPYRAILKRKPGISQAVVKSPITRRDGRWDAAGRRFATRPPRRDDDRLIAKRLARVVAPGGRRAYRAEKWDVAREAYREAVAMIRPRRLRRQSRGALRGGGGRGRVTVWREVIARGGAPPDLMAGPGDALRTPGRLAEAREAYARSACGAAHATAALYALAARSGGGDVSGRPRRSDPYSRAARCPGRVRQRRPVHPVRRSRCGRRFFAARSGEAPAQGDRAWRWHVWRRLGAGGATVPRRRAATAHRTALAVDQEPRGARDYSWTTGGRATGRGFDVSGPCARLRAGRATLDPRPSRAAARDARQRSRRRSSRSTRSPTRDPQS